MQNAHQENDAEETEWHPSAKMAQSKSAHSARHHCEDGPTGHQPACMPSGRAGDENEGSAKL